jgi:hypothetical protein
MYTTKLVALLEKRACAPTVAFGEEMCAGQVNRDSVFRLLGCDKPYPGTKPDPTIGTWQHGATSTGNPGSRR